MGKRIREYFKASGKAHRVIFWLCLIVSIALIFTGCFMPPPGVIDASILIAVGELFSFSALGVGIAAVEQGEEITVSHKETSLTVGHHEDSHHEDYGSCEETTDER